jgi:RNase P/RNase MRP subunit p30
MKQTQFTDICIPEGNEQEYIEIARKLETTSLLFLYEPKKQPTKEELKKIQEKNPDMNITTANLIMKNTNKQGMNFAKANIQTLENKHITHVYDLESLEEKDNHHYRRSGMNQAIAKKIKEQEKTIIIATEQLITNREPHKIIGRIQQNLELIKKYDLKTAIATMATKPENLRAKEEIKSLIKTLGHEDTAKKAIEEITKQTQEKSQQEKTKILKKTE